MYLCMCVCVCVCERDIEREKQEYHILYYFFSCSYLFRNYFKYCLLNIKERLFLTILQPLELVIFNSINKLLTI